MVPTLQSPSTRAQRMQQISAHARAAITSLQENGLPPSPPYYTVWFEHHAGRKPELSHALDLAAARGRVTDTVMDDLSARFFQPQTEFKALSSALTRISGTLREALGIMASHGADAVSFGDSLNELSAEALLNPERLQSVLARLVDEAREMTRRTHEMGRKIAHSAQQIESLRGELEDTRKEANTDALTGLPNRRAFDAHLRAMAGQATESDQPLSMILIDIDHFKSINDRWGHPVGDAVLRRTAITVASLLRDQDVAARFGGEEFAVLLPRTLAGQAAQIAERIRAGVATQTLTLRTTGDELGDITASFGVAGYRGGEQTAAFLSRADQALYDAKKGGRNRVCGEQPARAQRWA
ncbi:GGDEF domain-containing protein [Rhodovarius crocodyli]|nr:GGDEF domain-containing protein [Rhodovarius crocodyli]